MPGNLALKVIALLIGIAAAIAPAKLLLRSAGLRPWTYDVLHANEPTMHEPDAVLGWKNLAGRYVVPTRHPAGNAVHISFLGDGSRRTRAVAAPPSEGALVLVGDSYTQGWAISDAETFGWKLQEQFPQLQVLNYGTGGYGTYQSLLVLERVLPGLANPRAVLYGFNEFHAPRNVAAASWLKSLSLYSRRSHAELPFATYGSKSGLARHAPERYLSLPL